jgi:hypothetical protein
MSAHIDIRHPEPPTKRARLLGTRPAKVLLPQPVAEEVVPAYAQPDSVKVLQPVQKAGAFQMRDKATGTTTSPETEVWARITRMGQV